MIIDDDGPRYSTAQRLGFLIWDAAWHLGLIKSPWIKKLITSISDVLIGAECLAMRSKIVFYRLLNAIIYAVAVVLGTLIGYYQLITRYYLGEFLIIWAVVGWSLFSLIRGFEPRDPAVVFRVAEYLS